METSTLGFLLFFAPTACAVLVYLLFLLIDRTRKNLKR